MATNQQALSRYEPLGLTAFVGQVLRMCRDAVSRTLERRRLYLELTQLDSRELADLRLQPGDIDLLVHGQLVPALESMGRPR